ncbi:hypothetical protein C8F01DRAFT_1146558 [Mycena amicta]|nr:hypothetical protein C8F01DRAFT_1146524 [Mycena amicta]KAJ7059257.1 hypothetical protein C8F01DRAFT_1146558 [Mycena amicta]
MALGGVLVTTLPHLTCIVVGFAVPITIDHILRHGRNIERFLSRVVRTVLDIGIQGIVFVFRSRYWAIVCLVDKVCSPTLSRMPLNPFRRSVYSAPSPRPHSNGLCWRCRHCTSLLASSHSLSDHFLKMLPHFLCVVLGLVMPFAVRRGIHILCKMDRFLVRIVHIVIAAIVCATRAGSSFAKRVSLAVLDIFRTASRFLRLSMAATFPYLRIVVLHLYHLPARYLYRAKRTRVMSKKMLRLVVAQVCLLSAFVFISLIFVVQVSISTDSALRAVALSTTNDSLEPAPTAAPIPTVPLKKRTRADKRYQRGKKLHADVEEKGKRKRA